MSAAFVPAAEVRPMLATAPCYPTMPASDLDRARRFYEGALGLVPDRVTPAGVFYGLGDGSRMLLFPSSGRASGDHTQMGFGVDDLEAAMADLRGRGVTFEVYDFPGFDRATSIASVPLSRSAWFKDTEGNLLGLVQMVGGD
jgi:catechol 2,3-dioxygenase-like lactoylglutathione lyase family enzyme